MDEIMICIGAGAAVFVFSVVPTVQKDRKAAVIGVVLTVLAVSLALAVCSGVPLNFYEVCARVLRIK